MPAQKVDGLLDEVAYGATAILVARRHDLDYGNGTSQMVLNYNSVRAGGVELLRGTGHESNDRRLRGRQAASTAESRTRRLAMPFEGKNVRFPRAAPLFDQGGDAFR